MFQKWKVKELELQKQTPMIRDSQSKAVLRVLMNFY